MRGNDPWAASGPRPRVHAAISRDGNVRTGRAVTASFGHYPPIAHDMTTTLLRSSAVALSVVACAANSNPPPAPVPSTAAQVESASKPTGPVHKTLSVAVNQLGYLPAASKWATVVTDAASSLPWKLLDASDAVVADGQTQVFGPDRSSGDPLHRIDFSRLRAPGEGYRLLVDGIQSPPFAIRQDLYADLKRDALHFFYHQRSGVPIELPYAGAERWVRAAGHPGDKQVECLPELECGFTLDVHGGWYDAGDHGKYVVNGGISAWTLLNLYEHATRIEGRADAYGDGGVPIPERKNEIDDVLDEARFEVEFLLRMQVPQSAKKWKGMAIHKVHDIAWTPLPTNPATSAVKRHLHAPSTAATLNLAAVAAQAARLWKPIDPKFAAVCLKAAERAWVAAKANPAMFALPSDSTGGGPYDDDDVSDEFYWAAAELFLATKGAEYKAAVEGSPHFAVLPPTAQTAMDWKRVAALGTISLAVGGLEDPTTQAKARAAIIKAADAYLASVAAEGYRTPLPPTPSNQYPWGSNSWVLNNAIVLALAHDFTQDRRYYEAVVSAMDYVLGRNAMGQSYVTGYGAVPLRNPHHRFWAHQLDPRTPPPPPGIVSGGPNSALQDPYAQAVGLRGCAPQKCFVDHIESWSTNEITINWNAPLAWIVDDLHGDTSEPPS